MLPCWWFGFTVSNVDGYGLLAIDLIKSVVSNDENKRTEGQ